jgi:hypothetical protein
MVEVAESSGAHLLDINEDDFQLEDFSREDGTRRVRRPQWASQLRLAAWLAASVALVFAAGALAMVTMRSDERGTSMSSHTIQLASDAALQAELSNIGRGKEDSESKLEAGAAAFAGHFFDPPAAPSKAREAGHATEQDANDAPSGDSPIAVPPGAVNGKKLVPREYQVGGAERL